MCRMIATHRACQSRARTCGQIAACSAARPSMANGEDKGKTAAAMASDPLGLPTPRDAKANKASCAMVTGMDRVWTSRTVEAWAPMPRNTAPISK